MKEGLWKIIIRKDNKRYLISSPPASISNARNIREVILEFKYKSSNNVLLPFISHENVEFNLNYFLVHFQHLRRVDLVLPDDWKAAAHTRQLERKLAQCIRIVNSRLGLLARLITVPALYSEEEEDGEPCESRLALLRSHDCWFWHAEDGRYLRTREGIKTPGGKRLEV